MLRSMPPVADDRSRVVILGSMPGRESLEKRQYYARKQNSFWRIVHALYDDVPSDGYEDRVDFVRQRGMALWDVLCQCEREGSSDSSITNEEVNDLERFFLDHRGYATCSSTARRRPGRSSSFVCHPTSECD